MANSYLRFWGVRGSFPAPYPSHMRIGGNTPCVELRLGEHLIILDAGTGIISLGRKLAETRDPSHLHLFLTHFHWDHIAGLPFFDPAFREGFEIDMHGPSHSAQQLEAIISEQMKAPYFPVGTATWLARVRYHAMEDTGVQVGPATVRPFVVHHPGLTFGYRVETPGQTVVFAPDNEIFFVNHTVDARRAEFDPDEQDLLEALKEEQRGRVLEFMRDADVLIHDAQYTPQDYQRKKGWGHSCYIDTVNCAIDAGVKSLYLFHLDPNYTDEAVERMHAHALSIVAARGSSMECLVAREGTVVPLDD
jgi:phosphoribosyl 1,2-cyclic phosphodiesterase